MKRQTVSPQRAGRMAARSRRILAAALATGLVAMTIAAMGCNGILGIDERTLAADESALSCQAYCDTIQATCTAEFQEYQTPEACLSTCGQIPLGAESDTSGNTVGCRMHNVELAKDTGELVDYCPISGPVGGGSCGDRCENFCTLFVPTCAAYTTITDQASCLSFCQSSPDNAVWDPQDPNQKDHDKSIQCRIWHLANAVLDPTLHCGHAAGTTKCEGLDGGTTSASTATGAGGGGGGDGGGEGGG